MNSSHFSIDLALAEEFDQLSDRFESLWQAEELPLIEDLINISADPEK